MTKKPANLTGSDQPLISLTRNQIVPRVEHEKQDYEGGKSYGNSGQNSPSEATDVVRYSFLKQSDYVIEMPDLKDK